MADPGSAELLPHVGKKGLDSLVDAMRDKLTELIEYEADSGTSNDDAARRSFARSSKLICEHALCFSVLPCCDLSQCSPTTWC
jgi:hypothetical protein